MDTKEGVQRCSRKPGGGSRRAGSGVGSLPAPLKHSEPALEVVARLVRGEESEAAAPDEVPVDEGRTAGAVATAVYQSLIVHPTPYRGAAGRVYFTVRSLSCFLARGGYASTC